MWAEARCGARNVSQLAFLHRDMLTKAIAAVAQLLQALMCLHVPPPSVSTKRDVGSTCSFSASTLVCHGTQYCKALIDERTHARETKSWPALGLLGITSLIVCHLGQHTGRIMTH